MRVTTLSSLSWYCYNNKLLQAAARLRAGVVRLGAGAGVEAGAGCAGVSSYLSPVITARARAGEDLHSQAGLHTLNSNSKIRMTSHQTAQQKLYSQRPNKLSNHFIYVNMQKRKPLTDLHGSCLI